MASLRTCTILALSLVLPALATPVGTEAVSSGRTICPLDNCTKGGPRHFTNIGDLAECSMTGVSVILTADTDGALTGCISSLSPAHIGGAEILARAFKN